MKYKRQSKILELINEHDIETQEDLAEKLSESGFPTTQATISRDIKQLKIIKVQTADDRYKYATGDIKEQKSDAKFYNILRETIVNVNTAKNLIVIKTYSGMAQAAAAAIDAIDFSEIIGTIAGDDTIFIAFASDETASLIADRLCKIIW